MPHSNQHGPEPSSVEARYPNVASWVQDRGYVEIGHDDFSQSFVRALDLGGLVWEGETEYRSLDEVLQALDDGIGAWIRENG